MIEKKLGKGGIKKRRKGSNRGSRAKDVRNISDVKENSCTFKPESTEFEIQTRTTKHKKCASSLWQDGAGGGVQKLRTLVEEICHWWGIGA